MYNEDVDNDLYKQLSKSISTRRVIYDFGAGDGRQARHFKHHRRYIAIQPDYPGDRFETDNTVWFMGTIKEFFNMFTVERESFAICNAVPSKEVELVRANCPYIYINYPITGD